MNKYSDIHIIKSSCYKIPKFFLIALNYFFYTLILSCTINTYVYSQKIKFEHFTLKEGLSQSTINCILQDSHGFLWIGTQDGLNKYDGYGFTVYKHEIENKNSLSSGFIQCLYEDSTGALWIGTFDAGLNRFDPKTESFSHFQFNENNPNSLSDNRVKCLHGDKLGNLWIGTWGGGLNKFHLQNQKFTRYISKPGDIKTVSNNWIRCLYEDKKGSLWVGTRGGGINKYDNKEENFERFYHDSANINSINRNEILSIFEDNSGNLWIGTDGGGLNKYDPSTKKFSQLNVNNTQQNILSNYYVNSIEEDGRGIIWLATSEGLAQYNPKNKEYIHYVHDPSDQSSITGNEINCIYKDRNGILWIGTNGDGLNKYDYYKQRFNHFKHEASNANSLTNNDVNCILESTDGTTWIGTNGGGLDKYNPKTKEFQHYSIIKNNKNSLNSIFVKCLAEDYSGNIWIGTFGGGLNMLNPETENFFHFIHEPNKENTITSNSVKSLFVDSKNNLWVGTYGGGINVFSLENYYTNSLPVFLYYKHIEGNNQTISNNLINNICEDADGNIWVATWDGLNKINTKSKHAVQFKNDPSNPRSIHNNDIMCLYFDKNKTLWVGTHEGGLYKMAPSTNEFIQFTTRNGLSNNVINGFVEDEKNNLWISTNNGISKLNLHTLIFKNYDVRDGLQSNEFNHGAFHKSHRGIIYFGGVNGFNSFYPDKINDNTIKPPISIISFKKFDKEAVLEQSIQYTKSLILNYDENFFSFEFTSMNFTIPEKNQYAYKIDEFDKDWIYCGTRRYASYTNLDPGTYVFRVKGSNNDGIWNEEGASVNIVITPPFWKTLWFRMLCALGISAAFFGYIKIRELNLRKRQKELVITVQERTEELSKANDELAQKNKDITDSINYARRIQDAIMLPTKEIYKVLNNSFIFYRPKDIVSGDFYWFYELDAKQNNKDKGCIIAAVDCTGHGVPGAFMSMIGNNLLNQIIIEKKITRPDLILNNLHEGITFALHQDKVDSETKDGMDIALCNINFSKRTLQFAGAHRPLFIIKNKKDNNDIIEIKADRVGIGGATRDEKRIFKNNEIILEKDDLVYAFSDGFIDQFGGEKNKKYMTYRFKKFLLSIQNLNMNEQFNLTKKEINTWGNNTEQTDDILVIGIRF